MATILSSYCDVYAIDMISSLHADIASKRLDPERARLFKVQLLTAIKHKTMTPGQYNALTGENEYTTQGALQAWLVKLWSIVFPGEGLNQDKAETN
jgi:hypothetical protein